MTLSPSLMVSFISRLIVAVRSRRAILSAEEKQIVGEDTQREQAV